ncbi:MAG: hypothetical protein HRU40_11975 [Saprospiraceae bacterium]|nr:hypothetical protein [Saprospiraceae bacterium]
MFLKFIPYLLILTLSIVLWSCSGAYSKADLNGTWTGVEITEEGLPLDGVNPQALSFSFSEEGYNYIGNLNYREAGNFELTPPYLHTTDTLNQATTKKTVEIISITSDSMQLRMMENGKERLLKLAKQEE